MKKLLSNRGFSDKLYYFNFRMVWIFTWACFALNAVSNYLGIEDLSVINAGIPVAFAELGIHTGFIIWKAKNENISKFGKNIDESEGEV